MNKTKKGDKYLKINIDPPYQAETENKPEGKKDDEDDDDIPFWINEGNLVAVA